MPSPLKNTFSLLPLRIALTLALALPVAQAMGQETQGRDPALPDLAPREVEILGQLEITFPSLQRQPLIGFNPPPRVPEIPSDRRPYVEPYKQESADLPPSPLQAPEPPPVSSLTGAAPIDGEFEATAGRYLSRMVRARVGVPVSETATFSARVDYRGSDGFTPFEQAFPDLKNPYDALEATASLQTRSSVAVTGATFDGFFENYTLYGVRSPVRSLFVPFPDREGRGGSVSLWVRTQAAAAFDLDARIRYGAARIQTDVFADPANEDPNFTRLERRLDFDGALAVPLSSGKLSLDARASTAGLDTDGFLGSTVQSFDAGAGYRFLYRDAYHVTLGLRVLGFSAEGQTPTGGNRSATYVSPDVRIDFYPRTGLNLYAQNRPALETLSLGELYRENPYLVDEPRMQPTLRTVDAEIGVRYFIGNVQLAGRAGFEEAPNYLYFEQEAGRGFGVYSRGLTSARYGKARIYRVGGEASFMLTSGLHASVGLDVRKGRLTRAGANLPYFAPLKGTAMLSYIFGGGDGLIQLSGVYESPRYGARERTPENRVGAYFNLDVEASYQVTPWIGIIGRTENLVGNRLTRWDNYPEIPTAFLAGLRIRF
ncbi:hypothetical protein [Rhodocaloribacter sp.]